MRRTTVTVLAGLLGALVAAGPGAGAAVAAPAKPAAQPAAKPAAAPVTPAAVTRASNPADVVDRPADGVLRLEGHGWGHGRGMSQWGAQGAASQGRTADEITATYYPGTERAVIADTPIRVWLQGDEGRDTQVHAADGLVATDAATGLRTELPAGPTRWRAVPSGAGLQLQSLTGSTWSDVGAAVAGPLRFNGPAQVRVQYATSSRDYRGAVQAVRTASGVRSVNVVGLEDYLLGVVPRESASTWHPAALQAQAIAARSYSASKRSRVASGAAYDICDTTTCQVYGGSRLITSSGRVTELEPATTSAAVRATSGVIRTWRGAPVHAEFSSSNGGHSTDGRVGYLVARPDPWDGALPNPVHRWSATLPVSALEKRFPALGTLTRLRVVQRDGNGDWGGRVQVVVLEGSKDGRATTVTTTGAGVYAARSWPANSEGLRSSWWRVLPVVAPDLAGVTAAARRR